MTESKEMLPPVSLPARTRKHSYIGEHRIAACDSIDGNQRTERACIHCGIIKVTVHPPHGLPWREWRTAKGERLMQVATPPCEGTKGGE